MGPLALTITPHSYFRHSSLSGTNIQPNRLVVWTRQKSGIFQKRGISGLLLVQHLIGKTFLQFFQKLGCWFKSGPLFSLHFTSVMFLVSQPSILRRAKREDETMKREIEAARKATVRMRRAALRAMLGRESAQFDQELRRLHDKAFYKRRQ